MGENSLDSLLLEDMLCFPLYACAKEVVRRYRAPLEALGLTYTQFIVMTVLWEEGSLTEGHLGARLYLDSGTLAPLLKRLENADLLVRSRPKENERALLLSLTEKGAALKSAASAVPGAVQKTLPLTEGELSRLQSLLGKILDALHHEGEEA